MSNLFTKVDFSYYMILIAGLMPYLFTIIAKVGNPHPYNNHDPREFLSHTKGKQKRANNAQLNSFEAFPLFAIGVLVAHQKMGTSTEYTTINMLSMGFVVARLLYGVAYINDWAIFRSIIWFIGLMIGCILYL